MSAIFTEKLHYVTTEENKGRLQEVADAHSISMSQMFRGVLEAGLRYFEDPNTDVSESYALLDVANNPVVSGSTWKEAKKKLDGVDK